MQYDQLLNFNSTKKGNYTAEFWKLVQNSHKTVGEVTSTESISIVRVSISAETIYDVVSYLSTVVEWLSVVDYFS